MLFGDTGRFIGIIFGITLASFIITQQGSIFSGLMSRTFGFVTDTTQPDLWVMDAKVQYVDDTKPMISTTLLRVKGVEGIEWASPLYKGMIKARLSNGTFQNCNVIGLDDATLIGGPPTMLHGSLLDLRQTDSVIVDEVAAKTKLAREPVSEGAPKEPLQIGDTLELNDNRAVVVGIAQISRTFGSQPTLYTTFSRATTFAPRERNLLSFILVKVKAGTSVAEVQQRIEQLGLQAITSPDFKRKTVMYFLKNTGIPINFGIAVLLGLFIGTAIAGQTFYSFTIDNLKYFGALKAMGTRHRTLLMMILTQAVIVGLIGYGLGVGLASRFYYISLKAELAFFLPWQLLAITGVAVIFICCVSALLSIRKVLTLEPAVVFRT